MSYGISDKSTAEVNISDDGFVFVTSGQGHRFLVGNNLVLLDLEMSRGLEPMGGNLFQAVTI